MSSNHTDLCMIRELFNKIKKRNRKQNNQLVLHFREWEDLERNPQGDHADRKDVKRDVKENLEPVAKNLDNCLAECIISQIETSHCS